MGQSLVGVVAANLSPEEELEAELKSVKLKLATAQQAQDRQAIGRLMRKRGELTAKLNTQKALSASASATATATAPASSSSSSSSASALSAGSPAGTVDEDDRSHVYRVMSVTEDTVTVDRPVHTNPDRVLKPGRVTSHVFVPDMNLGDGYLGNVRGLFPAPLVGPLADTDLGERICGTWYFLGQIMAKALQDGFIVPLPLCPAFFRLVRGEVLLTDPASLAGPISHMSGCTGESVSKMLAVLPKFRLARSGESEALRQAQRDALLDQAYDFTGKKGTGNAAKQRSLREYLSDPHGKLKYLLALFLSTFPASHVCYSSSLPSHNLTTPPPPPPPPPAYSSSVGGV